MKKFKSVLIVALAAALLCTGISVQAESALAGIDDKVYLKETVLLNQPFDTPIEFSAGGNTTAAQNKWQLAADNTGSYITTNGSLVIDCTEKNDSAAVGARYIYGPQDGDVYIKFRIKRLSNNQMMLQMFFNEKYRYNGTVPNISKQNVWYDVIIHMEGAGNVRFCTKEESASIYKEKLESLGEFANYATSQAEYDQIKFFIGKGTSAKVEIDDLMIVAYDDTDGILFNEDFENIDTTDLKQGLKDKGMYVTYNNQAVDTYAEIAEETNGNHYFKLKGSAENRESRFTTGEDVYKSQLPIKLPDEFYISMRIMHCGNQIDGQIYINGGTGNAAGARRISFNSNASSVYVESGVGVNTSQNETQFKATANEWITLIFHIKGDKFDVYGKKDTDQSFIRLFDTQSIEKVISTPTANYFKLWTKNHGAADRGGIDDLRIYEPGTYIMEPSIKASGNSVTAEAVIFGDVLLDGSSPAVTGVLAAFDSKDMMTAANQTDSSVVGVMASGGKLKLTLSSLSETVKTARLYLWDGVAVDKLQPMTDFAEQSVTITAPAVVDEPAAIAEAEENIEPVEIDEQSAQGE